MKAIGAVLATAWLSMAAGLLFWANTPMLWGWQPRLVLSGSMAPHLQAGDVVLTAPVVEPRAIPPGQVLAVLDPTLPAGSYLHRLVRHDPDGRLVTRGDANRTEDYPPVPGERVIGQLRAVVPMVGRPMVWLRGGNPLPLLGLVAVTGLAVTVVTRSLPGNARRFGAPVRR